MDRFIDTANLPWTPVRPELTRGVFGRTLLDGPVKVVLTRVEAGGAFPPHRDPYGHLFYLLSGEAVIHASGEERRAGPGTSIRFDPGEEHGYRNEGPAELILLSLNLPA